MRPSIAPGAVAPGQIPPTGAFRLDARLTPDAGASLLASLRAESTRVFDQARKDGLVESSDAYAADALVALVTGRGNDSDHSGGGTDTEDPGSNRQAKRPGLRASVHVRVDLDALRTGVIGDGQICEIPGVGPIPVETATELMGDALCHLVITNGIDVTTICHLGRSIPAALKIALIERDPTCVVPGCDVATRLEIDHRIVPFARTGRPRCGIWPVSVDITTIYAPTKASSSLAGPARGNGCRPVPIRSSLSRHRIDQDTSRNRSEDYSSRIGPDQPGSDRTGSDRIRPEKPVRCPTGAHPRQDCRHAGRH